MEFDQAYALYHPEILILSRTQRVFGLEPDDIASEMTLTLWRATQTYDPAVGAFGPYWWSIWLNRKGDLNASYAAVKRIHAIPTEWQSVLDSRLAWDMEPPVPPPATNTVGKSVWFLLMIGESGQEARKITDLSKRAYYDLIRSWRTQDVRDGLTAPSERSTSSF